MRRLMSGHGSRALILAAIVLVTGGALLWWVAGRPSGVDVIGETVAAAQLGETVDVAEVASHPWSELHVFAPLTPPHRVEAVIGQRVGQVRGLVRDDVMLLVLTGDDGRVTASGLVARSPVDWLPAARERPYARANAVFRIEAGGGGPELHPADGSGVDRG